MRITVFIIICCFISYPAYAQTITVKKNNIFSISEEYPVGSGTTAKYGANGNVFLHDISQTLFRIFNEKGDLQYSFGKRGRGPGDLGRVRRFRLSDDDNLLMALDFENNWISRFKAEDGTFVDTNLLNIKVSGLHRFDIWENYLLLVGNHPDNNKILHYFDAETKEYKFSVGEFIDWEETSIRFVSPQIENQLNNGFFLPSENGYLLGLRSPYTVRSYSDAHTLQWEITDPVIPKPWIDHIEITPVSYTVKHYPSIIEMFEMGDESFLVHWVDTEPFDDSSKWRYYIDLRQLEDGSLITRKELPFRGIIHDMKQLDDMRFRTLVLNDNEFIFEEYIITIAK